MHFCRHVHAQVYGRAFEHAHARIDTPACTCLHTVHSLHVSIHTCRQGSRRAPCRLQRHGAMVWAMVWAMVLVLVFEACKLPQGGNFLSLGECTTMYTEACACTAVMLCLKAHACVHTRVQKMCVCMLAGVCDRRQVCQSVYGTGCTNRTSLGNAFARSAQSPASVMCLCERAHARACPCISDDHVPWPWRCSVAAAMERAAAVAVVETRLMNQYSLGTTQV